MDFCISDTDGMEYYNKDGSSFFTRNILTFINFSTFIKKHFTSNDYKLRKNYCTFQLRQNVDGSMVVDGDTVKLR